MPSRTQIRQFRHSDVVSLPQLICETIDVSYASEEFHAEPKIVERGRIGTVFVAEKNGKPIATGSLVDGEIFAVFVHPDHQGAGLGKVLMKRLEDQARATGATESVLSVSIPSKRSCEGLGYEIVQACSREVGEETAHSSRAPGKTPRMVM